VIALSGTRTVSLTTIALHVAVLVDGQRGEVGSTADRAVLGKPLPTPAAHVDEDLVLFAAERALVRHDSPSA
jgi:hypothetical protein